MELSYILPLRAQQDRSAGGLTAYLRWLAGHAQVLVVDGSPGPVFRAHAAAWGSWVDHRPPAPEFACANGKVAGVLTGLARAGHDKVVIADDDVRYDDAGLRRMAALLDSFDVVRPQNWFHPLPWHARLDTARTLLNRLGGGDWPGTLGVRRTVLQATGGYDGDVLFENLELVRTVRAAGGREAVPLDLFVRRAPPGAGHFWSQRVRQAYDEFARPARLAVFLAIAPAAGVLVARRRWTWLAAGGLAAIALAEAGRRRAGGRQVFPASASLLAPAWLLERGLSAWLAVGARLVLGGVPYSGRVLRRAATPEGVLRARHGAHPRAGARSPGATECDGAHTRGCRSARSGHGR